MLATTVVHVLNNIIVVFLGGFIIHLQDLLDPDNRTGGLNLHGRQSKHTPLTHLHPSWHTTKHSLGTDGVSWSLDGNRDTKDQHAIELQSSLSFLNGRDLAEPIVCTLVSY